MHEKCIGHIKNQLKRKNYSLSRLEPLTFFWGGELFLDQKDLRIIELPNVVMILAVHQII